MQMVSCMTQSDALLRTRHYCRVYTRHIYLRYTNIPIVLRYIFLLRNAFTSRKRVSCKHGIYM